MDQQKENDSFWMYIGGLILAVVVGVFVFKGQKAAMEPGVGDNSAQAQIKSEVDRQIQSQKGK